MSTELVKAVCGECHNEFEPSRKDQAFCGSACKQRSYRKRKAVVAAPDPMRPPENLSESAPRRIPNRPLEAEPAELTEEQRGALRMELDQLHEEWSRLMPGYHVTPFAPNGKDPAPAIAEWETLRARVDEIEERQNVIRWQLDPPPEESEGRVIHHFVDCRNAQ